MRFRTLALGITAVGLLAVGTAAPSPAAEVKKFEKTIAAPAPVAANATAGHYETDKARQVCPSAGAGDGKIYAFFELKEDFKFFFVSGPKSNISQPDPSGTVGTFHDYDLDLYAFDAKCKELEIVGSITGVNGIGDGTAKKPARYAAVAYYSGPPNLKVTLEASNTKIVKK